MSDAATQLRYAIDPVAWACESLGFQADPWQARVLASGSRRLALCCSRQAGKSSVTAALALHQAIFAPGSLVLIFSKAQRQSSELVHKIMHLIRSMPDGGPELSKEAATEIRLKNRSRIVSLPGDSPDSIRGFSAPDLVVEDEAAFCSDELYSAVLPMLATVAHGRLVLLSTPNGKRGHFHAAWTNASPFWQREQVTAHEISRISAGYLEEMREELGPNKFAQEFECQFVEADSQFFTDDQIKAAFDVNVRPLELNFYGG